MSITLSNFKGINNAANENNLPDGYWREIVDLSVNNSGKPSQRGGYTIKSSAVFSCVWSDGLRCFAVKDGDLVEVNSDYSFATLRAGVGYVQLGFTECNGDYYFVGDAVSGVIKGGTVQPYGQARIEKQPTVTAVSGGVLQAGDYLIAVTALDDGGIESGTIEPLLFVLSENNKALHLSDFPVLRDTRSTHYAIYASTQNGNELYRQGVINVDTAEVLLYDIDNSTLALNSIGILPAPFGQLIAYHYGHLFIADGQTLYYSEKFSYERWHPANNYHYTSNITAIMSCETGLWIATEKSGLFWIFGKTPHHGIAAQGDFEQVRKHTVCLYRGSEQRVEPDAIKQLSHGWLATAKEGIFLLLDGGQFANQTWDNIKLPEFDSCAGAIIEHNDSLNYLAIITGAKVPKRTI